ncbi:MAG: hypothetical protein PUP93_25115 [Rhizonema sp. NSF051]|nr:hypothetical protein [Rhizonema sp. NSF051]
MLEPSAGKGDIAQAIVNQHPDIHLDVVEFQSDLRQILELKGFNIIAWDFLTAVGKWQAIIANPPFSEFIEHTYHAYECLETGGILVTIAPESVFFSSKRKFKEFRDWMNSHDAWDEKVRKVCGREYSLPRALPDGAFLESTNPTGVSTRIIVVKKG